MSTTQDCLFCGIAEGRIPTKFVREDDDTVAFQDIDPQAPVHTLVIPRKHLGSLDEADADDGALLGALLTAARDVARKAGIADSGYRTVINTGEEGGQSVGHLHVHVLGGRPMSWPPG
jgi:histidine triad (HIT) family protein